MSTLAPSQLGITVPVTAIVPAYNAERTLSRAVASILAQTSRPAEIILIDDGSEDATWGVMERLRAQHTDVPIQTVRLTQNGGVACARNVGWNLAKTDFIAFLDADDAWHSQKLDTQYGWMSAHPTVVLSGHRCIVTRDPAPDIELTSEQPRIRRFALKDFVVANRFSTPSVMLRRDLTLRFAEGKRYSEDYLLWMQIVASHGPAAFLELPLAFLFKSPYGEAGLSADHWRMRLGEADTFARLRRQGIIGPATWALGSAWGWIKFPRRLAVQRWRTLSRKRLKLSER